MALGLAANHRRADRRNVEPTKDRGRGENVVVLGATGSIGKQPLGVIAASDVELRAHGLSTQR